MIFFRKNRFFMVIIFSIFMRKLFIFFLGSIPILSSKFSESPCVLGVANAFSGGVFLAIAVMHIMPEQASTWECI